MATGQNWSGVAGGKLLGLVTAHVVPGPDRSWPAVHHDLPLTAAGPTSACSRWAGMELVKRWLSLSLLTGTAVTVPCARIEPPSWRRCALSVLTIAKEFLRANVVMRVLRPDQGRR